MEKYILSLVSLVFGAFCGGFVTWFFYKRQVRWDSIREAGLLALTMIDVAHSNMTWTENGETMAVTKQKSDIASARKALNLLSLTCRNPKIVQHYLAALGVTAESEPMKADAIVNLRDALRAELGFGKPLMIDRSKVFIGKITGCE